MIIDSLRELNSTVPFQPYELHLADSRVFRVPHPDFIFVPPLGSYVIVVTEENDRPHHINPDLIVSATPLMTANAQ